MTHLECLTLEELNNELNTVINDEALEAVKPEIRQNLIDMYKRAIDKRVNSPTKDYLSQIKALVKGI